MEIGASITIILCTLCSSAAIPHALSPQKMRQLKCMNTYFR